ncbi:Myosin-binding protein 7 [Sesamum angolense]|uniref:Myosin-binding protein 7 n=1 Tax=Sesamum angolense TaxID=2727404 RepID=A0AAE1W0Y4_9LAMI|nr:Myosin-binding protein 7 [Sesamum angolense]
MYSSFLPDTFLDLWVFVYVGDLCVKFAYPFCCFVWFCGNLVFLGGRILVGVILVHEGEVLSSVCLKVKLCWNGSDLFCRELDTGSRVYAGVQYVMAEHSMVMSQAEITALKETLCAQQKLLQELYNELEAEREASASAASEALSVILRLQGEKAAVQMEAEQYKRLAEEKICHAEESFAIIEDIIYQKEMEVAALDYQVQSYRYKLISMGCADPGVGELKYPENLLQRNETLGGDASLQNMGRRNSAPITLKYKKFIERENSTSPEVDLVSKAAEELTGEEINDFASDSEKKADTSSHGAMISYGEQIRKLDMRVKEIAGASYTSSRNEIRSPSCLSSRPSAGNLSLLSYSANQPQETRPPSPQLDLSKVAIVNEIDQTKHAANPLKKGVAVDNPCSPGVHDVFEVPVPEAESSQPYESSTKDKKKTSCKDSEFLESKDLVNPEAVKLDIAALDRAVVQPTTSVAQPSLNQINRTSAINEVERIPDSANREEELKLLNEIKEKLNSLHDEIRSQRANKSSTSEKPSSLCHLPEAMLSFWL